MFTNARIKRLAGQIEKRYPQHETTTLTYSDGSAKIMKRGDALIAIMSQLASGINEPYITASDKPEGSIEWGLLNSDAPLEGIFADDLALQDDQAEE